MEELDMSDNDPGTGGCHPKGLGDFFQGGGTGGAAFWVGDMGSERLHGMVPWKIPTRGCMADNREIDKETVGGGMGTPTAGGING